MKILGLTGGMAMGKSTVAQMFRRAGFPVFDSDVVVHQLQAPGGAAVLPVGQLIPAALIPGSPPSLSRPALRQAVQSDPALLPALEKIMHPLVFAARNRFLRRCRSRGFRWAVLDVPLLFETGTDRMCDQVVVVSAPRATQLRRIAARRGMTRAEAAQLTARQMPDREKRRRADIVIRTGLSVSDTAAQIRALIKRLRTDGRDPS